VTYNLGPATSQYPTCTHPVRDSSVPAVKSASFISQSSTRRHWVAMVAQLINSARVLKPLAIEILRRGDNARQARVSGELSESLKEKYLRHGNCSPSKIQRGLYLPGASDFKASMAWRTVFRRSSFSSSGGRLASPKTWTIPVP